MKDTTFLLCHRCFSSPQTSLRREWLLLFGGMLWVLRALTDAPSAPYLVLL